MATAIAWTARPRRTIPWAVLPRTALVHAAAVGLGGLLAIAGPAAAGRPAAAAETAEKTYGESFSDLGRAAPGGRVIRYVGQNAKRAIKKVAGGLVVRLPVDKPGRPQVGVETGFRVGGDFEITADYEIVDLTKPDKGYGSGVLLRLTSDGGAVERAALTRFSHPKRGEVFGADVMTRAEKDLKHDEKYFDAKPPAAPAGAGPATPAAPQPVKADAAGPADAASAEPGPPAKIGPEAGRLRLVREGITLRFLAADAGSDAFRELRRAEFGGEDVKAVALLADTGGTQSPLTVRLTGLTIRADALPYGPPPGRQASVWSVWSVLGAAGAAVLAVCGVLYWRRR